MLHISIKPEPLFQFLGLTITNSFLTSVIVLILLVGIGFLYSNEARQKNKNRFFYTINFVLKSIYSLFQTVLGDKINVFFPLLGALFFYILIQNWFGLLPGVGSILVKTIEDGQMVFIPLFRGASADLNTTLALGLLIVIAIQYYGIKFLGFGGYMKKFFNLHSPIDFLLGLLEVVSEISRVISFSFRLFGNIFAGEVLLAVIAFLVPVLVSFPFLIMEIFVGFIQALVFTMLSAVFLQMAISKQH